jgi:hypothetical protein
LTNCIRGIILLIEVMEAPSRRIKVLRTPALPSDYLGRLVRFMDGPYRLVAFYGSRRGTWRETVALWAAIGADPLTLRSTPTR